MMELKLNDQYEILNYESSYAIGDYMSEFKIKVTDNDLNKIIQTIKDTQGFQIDPSPIQSYNDTSSNPFFEKKAWLAKGIYDYLIIIQDTVRGGYERIALRIDKDSIITLNYNSE
ncbi:MAG: hypothetical protein MUF75_08865 [Bacteroidia bacterium]|nr:hypothetical protein [Bacteroidia bacterium]